MEAFILNKHFRKKLVESNVTFVFLFSKSKRFLCKINNTQLQEDNLTDRLEKMSMKSSKYLNSEYPIRIADVVFSLMVFRIREAIIGINSYHPVRNQQRITKNGYVN